MKRRPAAPKAKAKASAKAKAAMHPAAADAQPFVLALRRGAKAIAKAKAIAQRQACLKL